MSASFLRFAGVVALAVAGVAAAWAGPSGEGTLNTHVRLLVGRPPAAGAEGAGVFLLPGTVVVPGSGIPSKEQDLTSLKLKLVDAYRLGELEVRSEEDLTLERDKEAPVAAAAAPGVDIRLTLLGYDERMVTYRVFIRERGSAPVNPTVSVARGERGIVGSRDGADAPYLFLLLEPSAVGRKKVPGDSPLTPTLVSKVAAVYPEEARKKGISGVVRVEALIRKDGTIGEVKVLESPDPLLADAAVQAVRQWRYKPLVNAAGVCEDVWYTLHIAFVLN
jgi:TonB family protein